MAFLTKDDFKTHLKEYVIDAISDNDDAILNEAISRAMGDAKGYLQSRYDIDAIYETEGDERKPYATLIGYLKDIAKWYFINLANALNDWDVSESNYKNAIAELGKIQRGVINFKDWPTPQSELIDTPFIINSRRKRGNHI